MCVPIRLKTYPLSGGFYFAGQPVDRALWLMTPPTVNAYYNPPLNEVSMSTYSRHWAPQSRLYHLQAISLTFAVSPSVCVYDG